MSPAEGTPSEPQNGNPLVFATESPQGRIVFAWDAESAKYTQFEPLDCLIVPQNQAHGAEDAETCRYTDPVTGREVAVPFARLLYVLQPQFFDPEFSVARRCGNENCRHPDHSVLEHSDVSASRADCPGGILCEHAEKCLVPGRRYTVPEYPISVLESLKSSNST